MFILLYKNALFKSSNMSIKNLKNDFTFSVLRNLHSKFSRFGNYDVIDEPSKLLKSDSVPTSIVKPCYAVSGEPPKSPDEPEIKNEMEILSMKRVCLLAKTILQNVKSSIKPGMSTEDIDVLVRSSAFEMDCYPSPLNYRGFPKSCCTSVNNVACHGIPDSRQLLDGDIVSVDITVFHQGFHGDCCETFLVGGVDDRGRHLVDTTEECRNAAVNLCGPDVPFSSIGDCVEKIARRENLTVVPAFIGHGIGRYFHGPPDIYHCYNNYPGVMKPGMTFTVEPILSQGGPEVVILEDGWTALMEDNSRAAQFEHTILITSEGHQILTSLEQS